jgi:hypothetical protein
MLTVFPARVRSGIRRHSRGGSPTSRARFRRLGRQRTRRCCPKRLVDRSRARSAGRPRSYWRSAQRAVRDRRRSASCPPLVPLRLSQHVTDVQLPGRFGGADPLARLQAAPKPLTVTNLVRLISLIEPCYGRCPWDNRRTSSHQRKAVCVNAVEVGASSVVCPCIAVMGLVPAAVQSG